MCNKKIVKNAMKIFYVEISSKEIYAEVNQDANKTDYNRFCKELRRDRNESNETFELRNKIARNVEYLSKMDNTDICRYRCTHYKHWIYDELHNVLKDEKESSHRNKTINKFMQAQ
ncbi:hypothetical protein C922_04423 [Plasmodium inui San Antonio 1]|uniref:Uncharacterized protein n=1 Tax=Plasmodium inui San Antonio 1 TaxID=1237626 RepID=W6ZWH5_9APIC|nr:hypothetical protein C922_04423 [Plasmodium inui San Antonio 1]EUD65137.1 hypothetical protein C922_04423 [Plasmodium inui San Antonio 1]